MGDESRAGVCPAAARLTIRRDSLYPLSQLPVCCQPAYCHALSLLDKVQEALLFFPHQIGAVTYDRPTVSGSSANTLLGLRLVSDSSASGRYNSSMAREQEPCLFSIHPFSQPSMSSNYRSRRTVTTGI